MPPAPSSQLPAPTPDPIALEVYKNLFQGIVDEAGQTIMRAAHTVFIKETQDFVVALASPEGESFAASRRLGIWIAIGLPLRGALEAIGTQREGDVVPGGRPIRIKLELVARDGELTLDFSDTDPQVRAALNIATYSQDGHYLIVIGLVTFLRSVNPDITYNSGLVRPVRLIAPCGSLLNPERGAPCGARQATFFRVAEVIMGALAQAIPERIPAAGCGQGSIFFVAVPDFTTGRVRLSIVQPLVGGSGGRPTVDGTYGVDFNTGFYRNIPTEVLESDLPVLVERYGLRPDSGGPGTFRGGMGLDYALTVLLPEAVLTSRGMERYFFQPWGREGGRPGANGRTRLSAPGRDTLDLGKLDLLRPPPRATIEIETAGGGGYGDPLARDPELVLRDVLDALVSPQQARQAYGVAVADGRVDEAATAALRAGPRQPAERFDFGPNRRAYEARWPDELQTALNQITSELAPAPRQYVRGRLIEAIEQRLAKGEAVDESALKPLFDAVMAELEVSLLEAL